MSEQFQRIDFNDNTLVKFRRVKTSKQLSGFVSDIEEFNNYIGPEMDFDLENNITKVYLIEIAGYVAGYFDLAMAHLRNNVTPKIVKKGIESNVPALLLSRLAVDVTFQEHGVGTTMVHMILEKLVPKLKKISGCRYLMLNPRDDLGVRTFYENLGFEYIEKLKTERPKWWIWRKVVEKYDRESDAFLFDLIDVSEES
ncbi:MAG: hypothetical protein MAG458_00272 [Nitrosopumilus sp.]|nr:hypothetical protein [Nitrosopumilus sp.]